MNMQFRLILYGSTGHQVSLETSCYQDGINVKLGGRDGVTTFNAAHFADVVTALTVGVDHIEGLPEYCQCEDCRATRGKAFAERLATAQAERLNKVERNRETNNEQP